MSLVDVMDNAHHVVPNQVGKASNPEHSWIQGVDNCVVLCESCHYAAHEYGRYKAGAVPAPDFYPYSHGRETDKHRTWLGVMTPRFWSKW